MTEEKEKSDAEVLEALGVMAQWNAAQEELRRIANGDMLKFRLKFLDWLRRHWDLMGPFADEKRVLEDRCMRAERDCGELRRQIARIFND